MVVVVVVSSGCWWRMKRRRELDLYGRTKGQDGLEEKEVGLGIMKIKKSWINDIKY